MSATTMGVFAKLFTTHDARLERVMDNMRKTAAENQRSHDRLETAVKLFVAAKQGKSENDTGNNK